MRSCYIKYLEYQTGCVYEMVFSGYSVEEAVEMLNDVNSKGVLVIESRDFKSCMCLSCEYPD